MSTAPVRLTAGYYCYTYPTFVDVPQYINIHFFTPDGQQAFVSYPYHPNYKAAQVISVSWFKSVRLRRLVGQPVLLSVIEKFLTGWFNDGKQPVSLTPWILSLVSPLPDRTAV